MAKPKQDSALKQDRQDLELWPTLAQLDGKRYDHWESLTVEQQRKFVPYMYTYWMSSVEGKSLLQSYTLQSVNHTANTYLFHERISKHPQLQWLMLCASSSGLGKQRHSWTPHLNEGYARLKRSLGLREASEYFTKVYGAGSGVSELSQAVVTKQNHEYRLAKLYPHMKVEDIALLASLTTTDELDDHDKQCGN